MNASSSPEILGVDTSSMEWIPLAPGVWYKPIRFYEDGEGWISLVRIEPGARVPKHEHRGPVQGFNLQGTGRFVESGVVTRRGTFTYEPTGTIDTLVAEGGEDLVMLFVVQGSIAFFDESGKPARVEDAQSKRASYEKACAAAGEAPCALNY